MNAMAGRLRRMIQTHSKDHSPADQKDSILHGLRKSQRVTVAVQLATQLLLWLFLWLFDELLQASWQGIVLMLAPALVLFFLWSAFPLRPATLAMRRVRLLLLPCLWLDAALVLITLSLFSQLQLPNWPNHAIDIGIGLLAFATVTLSGKHGVAYGINALWWVAVLMLVGTLTFSGAPSPENLWPIFGNGIPVTLRSALWGIGGVWSVGLLFTLPRDSSHARRPDTKPRLLPYVLVPIVLVGIWIFYHCMRGVGFGVNFYAPKEKMIVLSWMGTNLLLLFFTTVLWLMLLPMALSANATCGVSFLTEAFPRMPRRLAALLCLLPPVVLAMFPEAATLRSLQAILPYRFLLSAVTAALSWILERRRRA